MINQEIIVNVFLGMLIYKSTFALIKVTCEVLLKTLEKLQKEVA